jgi:predicted transcriptional regulator
MASEILKLTAQIVISHVSMTELSPKEVVDEIREIYQLLTALESRESLLPEPQVGKMQEAQPVKQAPIPLDQIVKEKYVVCLECGKQLRTLKAHLRKAHNLTPKDYYRRFNLDPKKYPLVCKEYSDKRRKLAKEKGLGARGFSRAKA